MELIRDDVMLTSVPVIIITGSNRLEDEVRCLELGAVDFVRKPYNVRILKSKINNVIKLRESVMVSQLWNMMILQGFIPDRPFSIMQRR